MATAIMVVAGILLAAHPDECRLPEGFADFFDVCQYRYTGGRYEQELFRYRLFKPRSMKPGEHYPLLLWLHGMGEAGSENWRSIRHLDLLFGDLAHMEKYRFFVLIVQCPRNNPSWFRSSAAADDMLTVVAEILRKTIGDYSVDQDRVYLAGVSSGGNGCWEIAMRHPDLFAAVVPMGSGGGDLSRAANLVNIPIWAFHSLEDKSTPPVGTQQMAAAVMRAGGNICLTLPPKSAHDCWSEAFRKYDVMGWMLAQRRGPHIIDWTPPGCCAWQWRDILTVPCCFLAIVWTAWWAERRRRNRLAVRTACSTNPVSTPGPAHQK